MAWNGLIKHQRQFQTNMRKTKKKKKKLLKTSLRFSLTWKRRIKFATIIPIANRKSIYWFCVRRVFAESFLEQTNTIFKSSGWEKHWNILVIAECMEWLPSELTLQHHFNSIIPLVNIWLFIRSFFWPKILTKIYVMPPKTKKW